MVNVVQLDDMLVATEQDRHMKRAPELILADDRADSTRNHAGRDNIFVEPKVVKPIIFDQETTWSQCRSVSTSPARAGAAGEADLRAQQRHITAGLVGIGQGAHDDALIVIIDSTAIDGNRRTCSTIIKFQ